MVGFFGGIECRLGEFTGRFIASRPYVFHETLMVPAILAGGGLLRWVVFRVHPFIVVPWGFVLLSVDDDGITRVDVSPVAFQPSGADARLKRHPGEFLFDRDELTGFGIHAEICVRVLLGGDFLPHVASNIRS